MQKKLFEKFIVPLFIFGIIVFGVSLVPPKETKSDGAEVSFLNVGQGDSALIKTDKGKYILVDGGPDKKVLSCLGETMPPTKKELEAIILTHPHADHVAGLNYVLDSYNVKKIYLTGASYQSPEYETFLKKIKSRQIPAEKYFVGKNLLFDDVYLKAIWPPTETTNNVFKDANASSIAFELSYYESSVLFLGDLPNEEQKQALIQLKEPIDVLKVAHHGSKNGTNQEILDVLKPQYAVISVGAENSYGHPAPSVLNFLSQTKTLRTDKMGTIRFLLGRDGVGIQ